MNTVTQPVLERCARWRKDEYRYAAGHRLTHLARTLPVNFEYDVMTQLKLLFDLRAARPVIVVKDKRRLEQGAGLLQIPKAIPVDEKIIPAVDLVLALLACGVGNRETQVRVMGQQRFHERRFTGA